LGKLTKEVRLDEKLIERAGKMSAKKFEQYLKEKGHLQKEEVDAEPDSGSNVQEIPVTFKMQMFQARLDAIMEGIREFAAQHQIGDESRALELIVAEVTGAKHYAAIFTEAVPKLKAALKEDGGSAEEYGARMKCALEDHILAISDVLQRKGVKLKQAS
jgi:hypothetical protein